MFMHTLKFSAFSLFYMCFIVGRRKKKFSSDKGVSFQKRMLYKSVTSLTTGAFERIVILSFNIVFPHPYIKQDFDEDEA